MLRSLLPKKSEFFALFSRHAALGVQGAELLAALLSDLQSAWGDITRIVCELDRHQPLTF